MSPSTRLPSDEHSIRWQDHVMFTVTVSMMTSNARWKDEFVRLVESHKMPWIGRSDSRYEQARHVFNRFHDLFPFALVQTIDPVHIGQVLELVRAHDVPLAMRSGGHHVAGFATCQDGIVLDLSPFRRVEYDNGTGIVEVEAGARLADVDGALAPRGRVTPLGTVSVTGVTGLTLGGGIGWLIGSFGLTCDNLVGADVVLANGDFVRAEDSAHENLLWALRGGGGNFGVVTRLRFRTHALPPITTGSFTVAITDAADVLSRTTEFIRTKCPRELTIFPALENSRGGHLSVDFCLAGADEEILHSFMTHIDTGKGTWSIERNSNYVAWQQMLDESYRQPRRNYWTSRYGNDINDDDIAIAVEAFSSSPVEKTSIIVDHLHGAFYETGLDTSAFPMRSARFGLLIEAGWQDSADDDVAVGWARDTLHKLDPLETSMAYSNQSTAEDARPARDLMDVAADRLRRAKIRYDPDNVFRRNHNIQVDGSVN